jgi:hypothetical protein
MCPSYPSERSCSDVPAVHRCMSPTPILCSLLIACIKICVCLHHDRTSSGWGDPNVHPDPAPVANGPTASQIAAAPWAAAAGGSTAPSAGAWQRCSTPWHIVWLSSILSLSLPLLPHCPDMQRTAWRPGLMRAGIHSFGVARSSGGLAPQETEPGAQRRSSHAAARSRTSSQSWLLVKRPGRSPPSMSGPAGRRRRRRRRSAPAGTPMSVALCLLQVSRGDG